MEKKNMVLYVVSSAMLFGFLSWVTPTAVSACDKGRIGHEERQQGSIPLSVSLGELIDEAVSEFLNSKLPPLQDNDFSALAKRFSCIPFVEESNYDKLHRTIIIRYKDGSQSFWGPNPENPGETAPVTPK